MGLNLLNTEEAYKELRHHIGHNVVVVGYGPEGEDPLNVSIECEDCGEVLVDFNAENEEVEKVESTTDFMETDEAFDILYDLALHNALDPDEETEEDLVEEAKKQHLALKVAHDFIMNNIID